MQIEHIYIPLWRTQLAVAMLTVFFKIPSAACDLFVFLGVRGFSKSLRQSEQTGAQTVLPPAGSRMLPPSLPPSPPRIWPSLLLAGTCPKTTAECSVSSVLIALFDQG